MSHENNSLVIMFSYEILYHIFLERIISVIDASVYCYFKIQRQTIIRSAKAMLQIYTYVPALLSLEDARCDSEITIMRLGEVERMCIQSRVGEDRTAGRRDNEREGKRERE